MSTAAPDPGLIRILGFNRDLVLVGWGEERFVLNARERDVAKVDPAKIDWVEADEKAPSYARELVQALRLTRTLSAGDNSIATSERFQPPPTVREWASRGLELSQRFGVPLRSRTKAVAQSLSEGESVSRSLVAEMVGEFSRMAVGNDPLRRKDGTWTPTGVAWCLAGHSKILLADGSHKTIAEIVENKLPVEVIGFDETTGELKTGKVIGWHKQPAERPEWYGLRSYEHVDVAGLLRWRHPFTTPNWANYKLWSNACGMRARLSLTGNHRVWTPQGWREASKLGSAPVAEVHFDLDEVGWSTLLGQIMGGRTSEAMTLLAAGERGWSDGFRLCPRNANSYMDLHSRVRLMPRWVVPKSLHRAYLPTETETGSRRLTNRNCSKERRFTVNETMAHQILPWFTNGEQFEVASGLVHHIGPVGLAAWALDAGFVDLRFENRRYVLGLPGPDDEFAWHERLAKEILEEIGASSGIRLFRSDIYRHPALELDGEALLKFSETIAPFIPHELRDRVLVEHAEVPYELLNYQPPLLFRYHWRQIVELEHFVDLHPRTATPENLASGAARKMREMWPLLRQKYDLTIEGVDSYVANGFVVHNCSWGGDAGRTWAMRTAQLPADSVIASGDWLHDTMATLVAAAEAEQDELDAMLDEGDYAADDEYEDMLFRTAFPSGYPEDGATEFADTPIASLPTGEGQPVEDVQEEISDRGYTSQDRAENVKSQPRDANGRFASKGARFTTLDGQRGKVENIVGQNAEVRLSDGTTAVVPISKLKVDPTPKPKAKLPAGLEPIADIKGELDRFLNDFMVSQASTTQVASLYAAGGEGQTQSGVQPLYMAVVDEVDREAVLDLIAVLPPDPQQGGTLRVFKRENKTWVASPDYAQDIQGLDPPTLIKLDMDLVKSVTEQIDNFVEGQAPAEEGAPLEPGTANPIAATAGTRPVASLYDEYGNIRR